MSDKKEPTITVKEANTLLAELVTVLEQAIEVHGTHDLETIASLCCLPYELLLRLRRVLGSEQTAAKATDVSSRFDELYEIVKAEYPDKSWDEIASHVHTLLFAEGMRPLRKSGGSCSGEEPSHSVVLSEEEQQLLHLWREAANSGSDQLSNALDLTLQILTPKN